MSRFFDLINNVFRFVTPVSDFFWEFPANFSWYASIPVLGNFSLAVILLVGSGIFFTIKTGFIQVTHFTQGIKLLSKKKSDEIGISSLAAFFLSSAMRVGPGNILGVTGAISVGGPGALFWMWISAFFGMSTAYTESVLAQIFKEKKEKEFVGGLPFYGKRLLKNSALAGILLSAMFILYAICCLPAQGFNVVSSTLQMIQVSSGYTLSNTSFVSYLIAFLLVIFIAYIAFGGIKKVTRLTDLLVPVMAIVYILTILFLICFNLGSVPYFFKAVFGGAFQIDAIFGGAFGTIISQGVKRGLMSNEAGQGTITMAAGAANNEHPCEQGCVQSIGVFLDTIVVCTLTGFIVIMAHVWTGAESENWFAMDRLPRFLASAETLSPTQGAFPLISFLFLNSWRNNHT